MDATQENHYNLVIIGGGQAGLAAAYAARRSGLHT